MGILGGMPGDSAGSPDLLEAGVEGEVICPTCSGTGEGAPGCGDCYECGGSGLLYEEEDDYADLVAMGEEWERGMNDYQE